MKRFWKRKHKKTPKPPPQPISPGNSPVVAPGPSEIRARLGAGSEGECGGYRPFIDFPDLTVTLDERSDIGPGIAFQVGKDEDQELSASEASTSSVAIGVTAVYRDEPTGECSWFL